MPNTRPLAAPFALAALACLAAACGDKGPQSITEAAPGAYVKFFNFGVNVPNVNFYANDAKITAVSSTSCTPLPAPPADSTCRSRGAESTSGTAPGGAAAGGFYVGVASGAYTFTGRITAATDNGVAVATVPLTVADGKSYSLYLSGVYNTATKQVEAFVVEDPIPAAVSSDTTYFRFVNAIPNAGPLVLYFKSQLSGVEVQASAPTAYKAAGNFVAVPGGGLADLVVRNAGATAAAISRTGVSFAPGRVYTITARGDITVTSSTSANRPQIDQTANR